MDLTFTVGGDRYTGAYGWYGYGDAPYTSTAAVMVQVPAEARALLVQAETRVLSVSRDTSPVVTR